jgi:sugar lactone lactonase YvrE
MRQRPIGVGDLQRWGHDLHRPECVLATYRGDVFVSDWRGGVTAVRVNGGQETWLAEGAESWLRPNGIALMVDGSFLVANLGDDGGIWRLDRDGRLTPFLTELDDTPVPPANFVMTDAVGRTWISVSTRLFPRQLAWRESVRDGFVVLVDDRGARVVVDGLHYANEVRPDRSGEWLYVVETFGRRLSRGRIGADGAIGAIETVVDLGEGNFPDGFAFDAEGGIWITSLVSNRLLRFADDTLQVVLEDASPEIVAGTDHAFRAGTMTAQHLGPIAGATLQQLTSLAFGGPDRRDVFLGCLHSPHIYRFRADVAGA